MIPCLLGVASAQGAALNELLGASSEEMRSPAVSAGVATNSGDEFAYIDKNHVIPKQALQTALKYYQANRNKISNPYYLSVIDFSQRASSKRLYVINMRNGSVEQFLVAHGKGSDPRKTGYATYFSNKANTHASSLGFYKTGGTYNGDNGYSLLLDGLSPTNSNARAREIVLHGAPYVSALGRSWGCPAVEPSQRTRLINMVKGGSVIYAYHNDFSSPKDAAVPGQDASQPSSQKEDTAAGNAFSSPSSQPEDSVSGSGAIPTGGLPEEVANTVRPPADEDPDAQYYDPSKPSANGKLSNIPYLDIVLKVSQEEGVDPALVLAIIQQESRFNPKAHSSVGALGLMQVMPATARFLGVNNPKALLTPEVCIKCGVRYIKYLWAEFGNKDLANLSSGDINRSDVRDTIAAYNAGPGNVKKYGGVPPFQETRNYTVQVSANFARFKSM